MPIGDPLPIAYERPSLWRRLRGGGRGGVDLVPRARLLGPMPWVVAIMVAITVIAAAVGLSLTNVAHTARAELAGGITVQVLEPAPEARARAAQAALAVLQRTPGVTRARIVPDSEVDALLSPWLGGAAEPGGGDDEALPVPALIDAHLDGPADPARIAALSAALAVGAPRARIDAQAGWLRPVFDAIASLQWLALAVIAVLAAAMAAVVLLAARTALGNHRETVAIVHMLGGTDGQIAGTFQRAIGRDAAIGGVLGFSVAAAVIVAIGGRLADVGAGLLQGGTLSGADWLALALVPAAGVVLAVVTARLSVLRALKALL